MNTCSDQPKPSPGEDGRAIAMSSEGIGRAFRFFQRRGVASLAARCARGKAILLQAVEMNLVLASSFFDKAEASTAHSPIRIASASSSVPLPRWDRLAVALACLSCRFL